MDMIEDASSFLGFEYTLHLPSDANIKYGGLTTIAGQQPVRRLTASRERKLAKGGAGGSVSGAGGSTSAAVGGMSGGSGVGGGSRRMATNRDCVADITGSLGTYGQGVRDVINTTAMGDLYWSAYFITKSRKEDAFMSFPYKDVALQLVVQREPQTKNSSWKAVIFPFTSGLWGLIVGTAIFAGCVLWYLEAPVENEGEDIEGTFDRTPIGFFFNINKTLYLAFGTLTGYVGHAPKSIAGRLFGLTYFTFCMLAVSAYTANLASIMTMMAVNEGGIESIADLLGAHDRSSPKFNQDENKVCILENTAYGKWLNR
jgi:hypothetical protein